MPGTYLPFGLYFLFMYGSFVGGIYGTNFKYIKNENLEGHTCPANETLFDDKRSAVQCTSKCSETPACRGVVIQPQDFRCIGCKDKFLTSDRAPLLSGTHYYRLRSTTSLCENQPLAIATIMAPDQPAQPYCSLLHITDVMEAVNEQYGSCSECTDVYCDLDQNWSQTPTEYCENLGGRLADIQTEEEEAFLENYVISAYKAKIWLGATDEEHEGTFLWQDETKVSDGYINWKPGQPNNKNWGVVANCMQILIIDGEWKWNDADCQRPLLSICEFH